MAMFSLEYVWKKMLMRILGPRGHDHTKDDAPIREVLGVHYQIRNPMLDKGFAFSNPSQKFISWMENGAFDIPSYPMKGEALTDYVTSLDDDAIIHLNGENPFVYTYPARIFALKTSNDDCASVVCNQFDVMAKRLSDNIGSNRAVATLYQVGLDADRIDIPCLNWLQFTVRGDTLMLHVMFRSNDIYGAWPSNMYFLTYLGLKMQEELNREYPNVTFWGIDYHASSAHIYATDIEAAEKAARGD